MQRHRLPGGMHQALELQGQCYTMLQIAKHLTKYPNMKYLQQYTIYDREQGYRLAKTGRCVGQESRRQDLSTW